ncbi:MAG TPA: hypothetical protein VFS60_12345 [Thermoanaerobaculia bacterium]|nr:hypothetical protein [Thermoanaerobaculia bacterium]
MRPPFAAFALLALVSAAAHADFNVEVTAKPDFAAGLARVAVIAVVCHESIDCSEVEDRAAEELAERKPGFEVVAPSDVRKEVFDRGAAALTDELRPAVLDKLNADGVLEIRIPFANRGDGFGGSRRSEVRVEVRLVNRKGEVRMTARGSGRPKNVVSGTERVAGTVIEKILLEAFGH